MNRLSYLTSSLRYLLLLLMMNLSFQLQAATVTMAQTPPVAVIEQLSSQLFGQLQQLSSAELKQVNNIKPLVTEFIMPYVDTQYVAYKLMGRYIRTSTKAQRKAFVEVMQHYLTNTYAAALMNYQQQAVQVSPSQSAIGQRVANVRVLLISANAPEVTIDFKLRHNKTTGQWRAFDMVIEGISLLSSKQAEFAQLFLQQGIDQTISYFTESKH